MRLLTIVAAGLAVGISAAINGGSWKHAGSRLVLANIGMLIAWYAGSMGY